MPFAAVCCCFLRCVAACTFCYLCSPKMVPKCSPEASKHLQNRPKIDPKLPPGAPRGPQVEPKSYFVVLGSILEPNLVPLGTQNRPKIDTLREKCSKKRAFKAMFDWRGASPHFLYLLGVIFGQKTMKNNITLLCFLLAFPTLEKPCILQATLLEDSVFANMLKY